MSLAKHRAFVCFLLHRGLIPNKASTPIISVCGSVADLRCWKVALSYISLVLWSTEASWSDDRKTNLFFISMPFFLFCCFYPPNVKVQDWFLGDGATSCLSRRDSSLVCWWSGLAVRWNKPMLIMNEWTNRLLYWWLHPILTCWPGSRRQPKEAMLVPIPMGSLCLPYYEIYVNIFIFWLNDWNNEMNAYVPSINLSVTQYQSWSGDICTGS